MPQYVASLSYGKDSMAMLHVIKDVLDLPLDRIITADVWATDTIPADLPPMVEFKKYADAEIMRRWGVKVEHFRSRYTYEDRFYCVVKKRGKGNTKFEGKIRGFPFVLGAWCNRDLKMQAIKIANKSAVGAVNYIGIASDEPDRFHNFNELVVSPLVQAEWTEQMCRNWCEENGLLSPIYENATRGGCWFCHNQGLQELKNLRSNYPQLWELLLKWDSDSTVTFHADGHTVHDFEKRILWEEQGYKPTEKQFRWADVENPQMNIEQWLNNLDENGGNDGGTE